MITLQQIATMATDAAVTYVPKVLLAILTLIVGLKLIKVIVNKVEKTWKRKKMDASLRHFVSRLLSVGLKILLFVSVAAMIGIETTSFVAVIGAAGLAIGLALQGSLANFAGGVLILSFKPFTVGEYIDTNGQSGTVKKIDIFHTTLHTPDNKTIILPNGVVSNNPITNYSRQEKRRVDMVFGIGYDDDIKKAQQILHDIVTGHELVLNDPDEPFVRVKELADSSVNFQVRAWAKTGDYWKIYFDLIEQVKLAFDEQNISIPYPQMDVHLDK